MSVFHLHARLFKGPLRKPEHNELQCAEADDWDDIRALADELLGRGFTVWIYDHGQRCPLPGASDYRVVAHLRPGDPRPVPHLVGARLLRGPARRPSDHRRVQREPPNRWTRRTQTHSDTVT